MAKGITLKAACGSLHLVHRIKDSFAQSRYILSTPPTSFFVAENVLIEMQCL